MIYHWGLEDVLILPFNDAKKTIYHFNKTFFFSEPRLAVDK